MCHAMKRLANNFHHCPIHICCMYLHIIVQKSTISPDSLTTIEEEAAETIVLGQAYYPTEQWLQTDSIPGR